MASIAGPTDVYTKASGRITTCTGGERTRGATGDAMKATTSTIRNMVKALMYGQTVDHTLAAG